jgi:hypothetical protein
MYAVYPVPVLLTWINFKNKIYVDSAYEGFTMKEREEVEKSPISFLLGFVNPIIPRMLEVFTGG